MKFTNDDEAKAYGFTYMFKTECKLVEIGDEKVLLAGTPMIEDDVDNGIADLLSRLAFKFSGLKVPKNEIYMDNDLINPIKDEIETALLSLIGAERVLYSTIEY